eukprot:gene28434-37533_t
MGGGASIITSADIFAAFPRNINADLIKRISADDGAILKKMSDVDFFALMSEVFQNDENIMEVDLNMYSKFLEMKYKPEVGTILIPNSPRPEWLPSTGVGQKNVESIKWSLSILQWIIFIRSCVETETWVALVKSKGGDEYSVNMYDICKYFVIPWTEGTGCSIAVLMNGENPKPADLMISHAWGGSVVETYNSLQYIVNHNNPEDRVDNGLSISEQLNLKPFANIIDSQPKYGMWVVHTTQCEVYNRMWTVHEVDEAILTHCRIQGAFDFYAFDPIKCFGQDDIDTRLAQCLPEDKARGGFDRLNTVIKDFRALMKISFQHFLASVKESSSLGGTNSVFDWELTVGWGINSTTWVPEGRWRHNVSRTILPLGKKSYPFGWPHNYQVALPYWFDEEQEEELIEIFNNIYFSTTSNVERRPLQIYEVAYQFLGLIQLLPASSRSSIALGLFLWVLIVRIVLSKFATFTDESAVDWNPFKVDEDCPRFVIANVCASGLGDQLEHYVYFLAVAQALEATVFINGGLVD